MLPLERIIDDVDSGVCDDVVVDVDVDDDDGCIGSLLLVIDGC